MKRMAIALLTSALIAAPAFAQQGQGGNKLGNTLESIGRSLGGQQAPQSATTSPQSAYQQTYNESLQQYQNENPQQLQQDQQRLSDASNRLNAAQQALSQEMSRRGTANGNSIPGTPSGNYNGSSVSPAQNLPYTGPGGTANGR